jgi:hypothetical protein
MDRSPIVTVFAVVITCLLLSFIEVDPGWAYPGGAHDGSHDPSTCKLCHEPGTEGTLTVEVSNDTAEPGEELDVSVYVTVSDLGSEGLVGVFLQGKEPETEMSLAACGWNIVMDPNGGGSPYVEKQAQKMTSTEFVWHLNAPLKEGNHSILATAMHGGERSFHLISEPVTIEVRRVDGPGPLPEPAPELRVGSVHIPDDLHEGEEVVVRAIIQNIGNATAENITVQFFDRRVQDPDLSQLGWVRHVTIEPGHEVETRIWWIPGEQGASTIEIVVDPEARYLERDREDNRKTVIVEVGAPVEEPFFTFPKLIALWPQIVVIILALFIPVTWIGEEKRQRKKNKDRGSKSGGKGKGGGG